MSLDMFPDAAIQYIIDNQEVTMTNELKTRRLIVTLPDTSGEEADEIAGLIETATRDYGPTDTTVTHALGETLPNPDVEVAHGSDPLIYLQIHENDWSTVPLTPAEGRQLAEVLLCHADEIDDIAEREAAKRRHPSNGSQRIGERAGYYLHPNHVTAPA